MPSLQLVLIVQKLDRSALKLVLKRSIGYIFESGGTVRKMENLGQQTLPYAMTARGKRYREGHFFLINFDTGVHQIPPLKDKLNRDLEVIRVSNFPLDNAAENLRNETSKPECTLHLDMLPPPYRPSVIALQEFSETQKVKKYRHRKPIRSVGVDTDPF